MFQKYIKYKIKYINLKMYSMCGGNKDEIYNNYKLFLLNIKTIYNYLKKNKNKNITNNLNLNLKFLSLVNNENINKEINQKFLNTILEDINKYCILLKINMYCDKDFIKAYYFIKDKNNINNFFNNYYYIDSLYIIQ